MRAVCNHFFQTFGFYLAWHRDTCDRQVCFFSIYPFARMVDVIKYNIIVTNITN